VVDIVVNLLLINILFLFIIVWDNKRVL